MVCYRCIDYNETLNIQSYYYQIYPPIYSISHILITVELKKTLFLYTVHYHIDSLSVYIMTFLLFTYKG